LKKKTKQNKKTTEKKGKKNRSIKWNHLVTTALSAFLIGNILPSPKQSIFVAQKTSIFG